ncbi:MAG: response regulator [Flavobacteriales bacterium]
MCKSSVIIIEDQIDLLQTFEMIIESDPNFEVSGAFDSYETALKQIGKTKVDLVLTDMELPKINGLDGIRLLKELKPQVPIVVISVHEGSQYIFDSLRYGAVGYLSKNIEPNLLLQALKDAVNGGSPMSPSIARKVVNHFRVPSTHELTKRELDVLKLLSKGKTLKSVAQELFVSVNTIKTHTRNIYEKLHISSKDELIEKFNNL